MRETPYAWILREAAGLLGVYETPADAEQARAYRQAEAPTDGPYEVVPVVVIPDAEILPPEPVDLGAVGATRPSRAVAQVHRAACDGCGAILDAADMPRRTDGRLLVPIRCFACADPQWENGRLLVDQVIRRAAGTGEPDHVERQRVAIIPPKNLAKHLQDRANARHATHCDACQKPVVVGDTVEIRAAGRVAHTGCCTSGVIRFPASALAAPAAPNAGAPVMATAPTPAGDSNPASGPGAPLTTAEAIAICVHEITAIVAWKAPEQFGPMVAESLWDLVCTLGRDPGPLTAAMQQIGRDVVKGAGQWGDSTYVRQRLEAALATTRTTTGHGARVVHPHPNH